MNPSIRIMLAATALVVAPPLLAHGVAAGALAIGHPWSRETAPGQNAGGGFLTITNKGKTEDRLLAATSPAAADVQIHMMKVEDGVMRMRQVTGGLAIPAGGTLQLKPGGYHIMFMGLKKPFKQGDMIPATLVFARQGKVAVRFKVQPIASTAPMERGHGGH
jgi:periplasmic copper chaperone A